MIEQVDRLIGNLLATGGEVFLPGVGSLYTERRAAQRLGGHRLLPPCRVVSFQTPQRGVSLVAEIATAAQCDPAAAQDVYDRWLTHSFVNEVLTVGGVGVLKFKNFTLEASFDQRLNPQGHEPVRVKSARGMDWVVWVGIAAILIAAGIFGYQFVALHPAGAVEELVVEQTEVDLVVVGEPTDSLSSVVTFEGEPIASAPDVGVATPVVEVTPPAGTPEAPASMVGGRFYVVLGVFSTPENAARAVADALAKESSLRCGVYRFGAKYLVSPFDASDAAACTEFIRNEEVRFPGMWTYTAR